MIYFYSIFISLVAGLAVGAAYFLRLQLQQSEAERKLWTNKVLIRDGQQKIFSDEMIVGEKPPPPPKQAQGTTTSPFRAGLSQATKDLQEQKTASPLPPAVQDALKKGAERIKENNNGG